MGGCPGAKPNNRAVKKEAGIDRKNDTVNPPPYLLPVFRSGFRVINRGDG